MRPSIGALPHCAALLATCAVVCGCGRDVKPQRVEGAARAAAQTGTASFYASELAGRPTASGEPLDPREMTAAHRTLPLGATVRVTNLETGRTVALEINDRGPYAKRRIVDVTPKAAEQLGMEKDGVASVSVQPLSVPKR